MFPARAAYPAPSGASCGYVIVSVNTRQFLDQVFLYGEIEAVSRRCNLKISRGQRKIELQAAATIRRILTSPRSIPRTLRIRSTRRQIGSRCGNLPLISVIGPVLPPQISSIRCVARSSRIARGPKSTPRSKRYAESELKPRRNDLPEITSGLKKALSKNISVAPAPPRFHSHP